MLSQTAVCRWTDRCAGRGRAVGRSSAPRSSASPLLRIRFFFVQEEKEGTTKVPLSDASDEEKKEAPDEAARLGVRGTGRRDSDMV